MTYQVLVRESGEKGYTAQVLAMPAVEVSAPTAGEAVARARDAIAATLREGEIIDVDVPDDPWGRLAGIYKDDPQFEDVLQHIAEYREQLTREELAQWDSDHPQEGTS